MRKVNELQLKYVDDFSLVEAFKMTDQLEENPDRVLPDNFHSRTGHILKV